MITEKHYTQFNEHPEDRIYRDKQYIKRLQGHIDSVFDLVAYDLSLNEEGKDLLFDYIYNEDRNIEFEEYLYNLGIRYDEIFVHRCNPNKRSIKSKLRVV